MQRRPSRTHGSGRCSQIKGSFDRATSAAGGRTDASHCPEEEGQRDRRRLAGGAGRAGRRHRRRGRGGAHTTRSPVGRALPDRAGTVVQVLVERVDPADVRASTSGCGRTGSPGSSGRRRAAERPRREGGDGLGRRRDDHDPPPDDVPKARRAEDGRDAGWRALGAASAGRQRHGQGARATPATRSSDGAATTTFSAHIRPSAYRTPMEVLTNAAPALEPLAGSTLPLIAKFNPEDSSSVRP